jgi:hypothetical protein
MKDMGVLIGNGGDFLFYDKRSGLQIATIGEGRTIVLTGGTIVLRWGYRVGVINLN